jgi:hypothetical protein
MFRYGKHIDVNKSERQRALGKNTSFDTAAFLTAEVGTPHYVLALFRGYGIEPPKEGAVAKWFQRKSVPTEYFPISLCLLELERGNPLRLAVYLRMV